MGSSRDAGSRDLRGPRANSPAGARALHPPRSAAGLDPDWVRGSLRLVWFGFFVFFDLLSSVLGIRVLRRWRRR